MSVPSKHKAWLDGEYQAWSDALEQSTVHNFRDNAMVARMLCEPKPELFLPLVKGIDGKTWAKIRAIDAIGSRTKRTTLSGLILRHVYYAMKVREMDPVGIVEIGGGCGHFLAVLLVLGWRGAYYIFDLHDVKRFQERFLSEVERRTGLPTYRPIPGDAPFPFVVSFYALGEFDEQTKQAYIREVVKKSDHGLIVWNPHSGASHEVAFPCEIEIEQPLTGLGNRVLRW